MTRPSKKGQSLVEVVVALSILMMVFVGAATLVMQSLNLVVMSRTRNEVVAISQRAMSEATLRVKMTCPVFPGGAPTASQAASFSNEYAGKFNITYSIQPPSVSSDSPTGGNFAAAVGNVSTDFYKIVVVVTWTDKGSASTSSYTLAQMVSK